MPRKVELVTNGVFAADSDWTKGTGWTIPTPTADCDASQVGDSDLSQDISTVRNRTYTVTLDYTRSAGSFSVLIGGKESIQFSAATGSVSLRLIAGSTDTDIVIRGDVSFAGTIDNVSVKEIVSPASYRPRYTPVISGLVEWFRNRF